MAEVAQAEVKKALKKTKRNKALGPDTIPIEAWISLEEAGVGYLTSLFNKILAGKRVSDEWIKSALVPKSKGDAQDYSNYRGIKLMSHTIKLWEMVVEAKELLQKL
ncbi:uncharacterized protein LOC125025611 [Penaeus chinensis]|uniref:uncharacterized protein LOC125025611 n=1 Tax=Penaeus chinensis TaxID=139456 RepID=UPI001FB5A5AA|nr:uncharacterized protein LOC125025611 [Penaeus chinensis]